MATQNTAMDNAALIKEVNEAHKHKKYSVGYHAQTVVAVIVTLIMLFPLYWMIATSFKSAEEVQLVIPTLFPHEFHPENYLNVLQKANFMKYYWNTIVMTAGILWAPASWRRMVSRWAASRAATSCSMWCWAR